MLKGKLYFSPKYKKVVFELSRHVEYTLKNGATFYVPVGFITDFATVPQWARSVINVLDKHFICTVLHDYLYVNQIGTRKQADKEFLFQMQKHNVKKWQRNLMYIAVRVAGGKRWKNKGAQY